MIFFFLYFHSIGCYFSSFTSCIFGSSLFSSWWAWLEVCLFYLFKKPALGFIDLFCFFLISILFIFFLIFLISFLLLTLGFVCSSFSNSLGDRLGWDFSYLRKSGIAMNFLELLLLHTIDFCKVVFLLLFVTRYFLISSLISSLTYWVFSSILFSLHVFVLFFPVFLCGWFLMSYHCGQKRCLK